MGGQIIGMRYYLLNHLQFIGELTTTTAATANRNVSILELVLE